MSYLDKNLLSDERILLRTKKHKVIFLGPVILTLFAIGAIFYMQSNFILSHFIWTPWLVTLIIWCYMGLEYFTSEFAVTNKRIMMREGFFYRHTNEMRLSAISQINVDQSLLGQLLDYGMISINAFGAFDNFTIVAKPNQFQQCVNQQIDSVMK